MNEPVLVIMAAGMGSRFGGLKQITPVDDQGHKIIDFSLYDAWKAGFKKAVFIIRRDLEKDFREVIGDRIAKYMDGIFISQILGANKPDKQFFDICFAGIPDFSLSETVIIGDSLSSDIKGGINAGIITVWFNPKGIENDNDIKPDYTIKELSEVPGLLSQISAKI